MSFLTRQGFWLPGVSIALFLAGCQSADNETDVPDTEPQVAGMEEQVEAQSEEQMRAWEIAFRRQRLIGDLLYDALRALQQDRLLLPADDNAYSRYQRVLALDPENSLAREGLQEIVRRYLQLAATASRQGRFAAADQYIDRARTVDRNDPAIVAARQALERDRNSGDLVFELDLQQLDAQSENLVQQLAGIADQAVANEAFVWITAPSDEKGRWIYGTMREQANGYRLRGNIELGGFAIIRLRMPDAADDES
ncbi:MAG: hypothetical protein R3F41_15160 [Gammaproteobacteria bacterium]|nr:hypothetical protein [Pseudomonadales bacterium]MCP5346890.1 hypothetical protein [Pseudomonadales bacterium]